MGLVSPAVADTKCCWSNYGDATSCGGYPSGASGGVCNTDNVTPCSSIDQCNAVPKPTPVPTPSPTPTPTPSPSPGPSTAKCCWSAWGDASSCGSYPGSGSGGLCTTDWKLTNNLPNLHWTRVLVVL